MSNCIFYIEEHEMGATIKDCALRNDGNTYPMHPPKCDGCKDYKSFKDAKERLTEDYVKVTRCGDCKFYNIDPYSFFQCNSKNGMCHPKPYDFCNYGERKK